MTYVTNYLNSVLVSQKQLQYAKYFSAFIAKGKNVIYGTYVVQRKREKSLGVEVKPFVMPLHRNSHTGKTVREVNVAEWCYALEILKIIGTFPEFFLLGEVCTSIFIAYYAYACVNNVQTWAVYTEGTGCVTMSAPKNRLILTNTFYMLV
jgi:hypothetical protein